ncbi:MAG TPA: PH domain-containing protein [Methylomirabilota bacterium]|nr:PH domain-containing protein [Methylomirabilota bacterium]
MRARPQFKAPWGRLLVGTSSLATLLLLLVPVWVGASSNLPSAVRWPVMLIPVFLLGICGVFAVRGYTVRGGDLVVHRPLWDTHIPLTGMKTVEVRPRALSNAIRTCGNGGLFSFTGFFWSRTLGAFRAYVTDLHRTVVVRLVGRTVVVSPDDPEQFVRQLRAAQT